MHVDAASGGDRAHPRAARAAMVGAVLLAAIAGDAAAQAPFRIGEPTDAAPKATVDTTAAPDGLAPQRAPRDAALLGLTAPRGSAQAAPLRLPAPPAALPDVARPLTGSFARPVPFDVDGDGAASATVLPNNRQQNVSRPSTTISSLANGAERPDAVPLNALSAPERRELVRILREDAGTVRELRVVVDGEAQSAEPIVDRPIVPDRTLRLDGEVAASSWTVFLSTSEAARGGTLSVAFTNSVLVLPEASRLRVLLNGRLIAQTAIDSPDRTKVIVLPVPAELLRTGENAVRLEADMRHRIDCSVEATYELWTRIDTRLTGFSADGRAPALAGLSDLPAVGVGTTGATRVRVLVPRPGDPADTARVLRAAQAIALRGRFVQPLVEVVQPGTELATVPGTVNLVVGSYEALRRTVPAVPNSASQAPFVDLVDGPMGPTVIISGPTERDVEAALAHFETPARTATEGGGIEATPPWLVPGAARIESADEVTLREAGLGDLDFSGRRFRTAFNVTLPADFYASAYGEATLLLDAAYSRTIEPSSQLTVFVNGVPSTSVSFTSSNGRRFESYPVHLGMQAFRPGINTVELAAELDAEADRACLPGGTVPTEDRFVLFASTRLAFPEFARIGQLPNLASFATNGFPYPLSPEPVRVRVGGASLDTLGAAGTLFARLAVSRGAALSVDLVEDVGPWRDAGVVVVAPLPEVPSQVLQATDVADVIPANWLSTMPAGAAGDEPEGLERYDAILRRLRQQLRQEDVPVDRGTPGVAEPVPPPLEDVADRGERWFDDLSGGDGLSGLVASSVRRLRAALDLELDRGTTTVGEAFTAPLVAPDSTLVMAQAPAPAGDRAAWTLVTAPTAELLSTSLAALTAADVWERIDGRVTAYALETNEVEVIPVERVSYIATLPLSFTNIRLIAANWFSLNNGVYAIALVIVALAFGVLSRFLVRPLGRRN
ncbi:cellulose biosynthesis cyclic di-GMP-binding regulatory protein BcsB [Acuticoccus sp.]|uniref:cellulose biosynthesis cyclic di-GMP-binding regulatory protein BcsB n=1 Tax=Acuticoccus sp. TaxID=1904378 RepID=UPI003B52D544